jgi:ribose-phosphate pyrophosphokinase
MTEMALTAPPLRRLFDRLDYAARPQQSSLKEALAFWRGQRGSALAPCFETGSASQLPAGVFLCRMVEGGRDLIMERNSPETRQLLGASGERIGSARNRRHAVRLRRLFQAVIQAGEPVAAEFSADDAKRRVIVDIVAAPIMGAEGKIDGVLGAISLSDSLERVMPHRRAEGPLLFALARALPLATRVARYLRIEVSPHEERDFEDGEHKIRPLISVRNRDVYVMADLATSSNLSVNDKLCRLLFFVGALKQSAAATVTVVAPYLCYTRKERQTKPRDPVTTRYIAQLLESVGTDRVITVAVHNFAAFQNAFRCQSEHLDTDALFAHALAPILRGKKVAIVSPDLGGEKRAELFREALERTTGTIVTKGILDKHRSMGEVTGELFAGDVSERVAIIFDDMISTGGTMLRAAVACRRHGASEVIAVATHGLFSGKAAEFTRAPEIDAIWITDSVPLPDWLARDAGRERIRVVSLERLLASAIKTCHAGGSINELLEHPTPSVPRQQP